MMYIKSRKRKFFSTFSSFLSNSFLLFSCHFPLSLNCQANWKRKKPNHSEDPNSWASSSLSTLHGGDYEVFLSFRGKDTRRGFTDYLYTSLVDAGIRVFRDDNELRVGEEIGPELFRCITQSKISIPIISEGYASSKWCLLELAHMLKCKRNKEQIVLPIFYKVEPSQVRHLTGRLGDAIKAHKKNLDEMIVKEWEEALEKVTTLKGWELEKIDNGHEGTLVKMVVKKVMSELKRLFLLNVPKQLVGIDDRVEHIMSFGDAKFGDTSIIGIYGMGGIGKTTLAKVLYNKLSSRYEYRSFVADIRETSARKGIECIQKQLIFDIIGNSSDVSNVDEGINVIKFRFKSKKVLVLLDDVDANTPMNVLMEGDSWFKAGSTIIITSRDRRILDKAGANYIYQLDELPLDQSLILFSRHAFRKDSPSNGYEAISRDVVSTTGGLPLALEVIGSFLCGKKRDLWKDTLKKLKEVPDEKVQEKLMISYKALDYYEQQIFLDIACLFIGSSKQCLTYMWDACGFFPGKGIEVLSLMSLIKINEYGNLMMHDQLRDLGREIIRLENQKEPRERSRLWNYEEAEDVLDNNKGSSKIEALHLDNWGGSYTAEQFKELINLRFLRVRGADFTGDFQNLLLQLRGLVWEDCPSDFIAANFHLKKLVMLNLSKTLISENWGGWGPLKMATELKVLNLSHCQSLRATPDLSAFKSLEILILENCLNLQEIHPSIGDNKALISLNVMGCQRLEKLPIGVSMIKELRELLLNQTNIQEIPILKGCLMKLETLSAWDCRRLAQLPESMSSLVQLTQLDLSQTGIEKLPESIGSLKELETLDASYCVSLTSIATSIGHLTSLCLLDLTKCEKLAQLPDFTSSLVSLQCLLLSGCHSLREIPDSIGKLTSLTKLHFKSIAIEEIPESIGFLKKLETLNASYCPSLTCLPTSISHLVSISLLDLRFCPKLAQLPDSIGSLVSLQCLLLQGCHLLREVPDSIGKLASLIELELKSTAIMELPESIGKLQNLRILDISGTQITKFPEAIRILTKLQELRASGCKSLEGLPSTIGELAALHKLDLDESSISDLPEVIGKLQNLRILDISGTQITKLPEAIGILTKLQELRASGCKSLEGLPSTIGELAALHKLDLDESSISDLPESIFKLSSLENIGNQYFKKLQQLPQLSSRTLLALALLKHPRASPTNKSAMDYQTEDSKHALKRSRPSRISYEVNSLTVNNLPVTNNSQSHGQSSYSSDDLPSNVVMTLNQGSPIKSMDFHPVKQFLLLAGTNMGDVMLWEVGRHARTALRNFDVWDLGTCSMELQASLANDYTASVNCVTWSPDGTLFGVAYSKHLVHIYLYHVGDDIRNHLEIEAHVGSVNDLAFAYPNKQFFVITCGEDRSIKVWDAVTGTKQHSFKGHEAPVYSICPHQIQNIPFIFSTSTDGKMKVWLYDKMGSRINYDAPGHSSTRMAYSTDGKRLFSCGTNKKGESYLVEWNENEGGVKCTYRGLGKTSGEVVLFDTTNNRFLAAGDEFMVKFWDMDNDNLLKRTDANGGLPASPCIRFSKEGILLAVSTSDNSIKILANANGIRLLRTVDNQPSDASRVIPAPLVKPLAITTFDSGNATVRASLGDRGAPVAAMVGMNNESMADVKHGITDESGDKSRNRKLTQINEPSQCQSIRLPDNLTAMTVNNLPVNILAATYDSQSNSQSSYSSDDLPKNVVMTLNQGSTVKSMDFHPLQQTLLLVGTNMGDVIVWEVGSRARIALRNFYDWDLGTCSVELQASLANDYTSSVNRIMWSPDGILFGVAYSKHMVHIYSYYDNDDIRNHLQIEAHVGSVNDLAFSYPIEQLCVVTCGDDRLIKVWDAVTGAKQHSFEGHEAPVYSICPHQKENFPYILSTATDGKIKAWIYDDMGPRVDYAAARRSSIRLAYSADGTRLFSCGTNTKGESSLVECNGSEGYIKRTYHGLGKRSGGVVQFDTTKNKFLAAGDEFVVKFWDMDNYNLLTSVDANGGLSASPCIRFNKEGILLAVSTSDNSIKILANADGIRLLRTVENQPFDASGVTPGPLAKNNESIADLKLIIADESGDKYGFGN